METNWRKIVKNYNKPVNWKSNWQVFNSFALYFFSWYLAWLAWDISAWLTLAVAVIAQSFFGRLFIIFHDCGHGTFYRSKWARTFWGYLSGIIWLSPFWQWTKAHATHHRNSGNLEKRGVGDIWTMTVKEYQAASSMDKLKYRIYRNPLMEIFGGSFFIFFLFHRITTKDDGARERKSVYITNIGIVLMAILVSSITSFSFFAFYQFFLVFLGGAMGILFFYVQHQFEEVYWGDKDNWDFETAALKGCTYLKLPRILQWASGNIGFHHIHHLSHSIPNYHLEKAYTENPYFQSAKIIELKDLWSCFKLSLYDSEHKKMLRFSDLAPQKSEMNLSDTIEAHKAKIMT